MTSAEPSQSQGLTTEQIATAGSGENAPTERDDEAPEGNAEGTPTGVAEAIPADSAEAIPADSAKAAATGAAGAPPAPSGAPEDDGHPPLLAPDELASMIDRWQKIQAAFVDEPRKAVRDADELVAQLMQRLAEMFARERRNLEAQWVSGEQVSTEDLRQGLRRYRTFFERLLAA